MGWRCEVKGCPTRRNTAIKLHNFRKNPDLLRKWTAAIRREELEHHPNVFRKSVCDLHFSDKQKFAGNAKNRTNLVADAFPDCNLPQEFND